MNVHKNARLTPKGRERLVRLIRDGACFSRGRSNVRLFREDRGEVVASV